MVEEGRCIELNTENIIMVKYYEKLKRKHMIILQ